VFDVVVVGVPDTRWGERVVAVVAPRPGCEIKPVDLDTHLEMRVARYKMPRDFVVVDRVVRSPSGKPDYRWARTVAMEHLGITAS
jgi:acyl-CoA synthetase (AMP-forming)/AMP-acid ligase II